MTNETEAPQSLPTARELFESVDALMRRNRRAGAVTAPLPPPEGHVAVLEEEAQALLTEIGVEPEAEIAQVTQQVESDTLEALLPASEPSEPLPEAASEAASAEDVEEETEEQAVEQRAKIALPTFSLMEDDLLLWDFAPRPQEITEPVTTEAEEVELPDEVPLPLTPSFSDAVSFLSAPEVLASPSQVSASYMTPPLTVTFSGVAAEHAVLETEPEPEVLTEGTVFSEEEIWLFSEELDETPDAMDAETAMGATGVAEALALLSDTGTVGTAETAKQTGDDEAALYPLSDTEVAEDAAETPLLESEALLKETAFSEEENWWLSEELDEIPGAMDAEAAKSTEEALALLSDTERVEAAEHDDEAVSYPLFDTEMLEVAEAEESKEIPLLEPEVLPEETAFSEEENWLLSEEPDEIPEAVDAEAAMGAAGAAEAPVLLSDTEKTEDAEDVEDVAEIPLPEPVSGFWYLVEEDSLEMESEAPEAAAEIEESAVEETGFSEAEPEERQKIESAEAEEKTEEAWVTEPEPALDYEPEGEEIVMSSVSEKWTEGINEKFFAKQEIFEPMAEVPVEADERPEMDVAAIEETVLEAAPEMVAEIPASMKTASVSAAALLSERQPQGDETKNFFPRYSAAQLLTAYQHQNPQTQNIKAASTAPPAPAAAPSTLALAEEQDSLLPIETAREPADVKKEKQVPSAQRKFPELSLEPLRGTWPEYSARSADTLPNEDDYYPVLTDVVDIADIDEEELSESNTA
jgi:hypothetical protein